MFKCHLVCIFIRESKKLFSIRHFIGPSFPSIINKQIFCNINDHGTTYWLGDWQRWAKARPMRWWRLQRSSSPAPRWSPADACWPGGCIFLYQFSISEIKNTRNSSSARAFNLYTPGHSWHNHRRRRHLLFLFGDYYEIGGLWVLERNIDVIKTRVLERKLPEIGFPMLQGDVVFEHRDRQTSQYPGAESCWKK